MEFLNTQILYLIGLAGLPILIHLLGKKRYKEIYFSDIRLLRNLEKNAIQKVKISQILILLMRTLIILFLVLFFARPYLSKEIKNLYIKKNSRLYLIIDNSLSMSCLVNNSDVFEESIDYLSKISQKFEYPFYLNVYTTTNGKQSLRNIRIETEDDFFSCIKSVTITKLDGKISMVFKNVLNDIEKDKSIDNYVWIISDLQESNLGSTKDLNNAINRFNELGIIPVIIDADFNYKNVSIRGNFSRKALSINNPFIINLMVNNWDTVKTEVPVTLYINEEKIGKSMLNIDPVGQNKVQFKIVPQKSGFTTGYAEIGNDNLPADNRWYFSVYIPEKIKILIVGKTSEDIRYIYNAIKSSGLDFYSVDFTSIDKIDFYELTSYKVVIFSNVCYLSNSQIAKLKELLSQDGTIIIFPGIDCEVNSYNRLWHRIFGFPRLVKFLGNEKSKAFTILGQFDKKHQLFVNLFRKKVDFLTDAKFFKIPIFDVDKKDYTIIHYSDGNPFLIECKRDSKILGFLVATGVDSSWSDLSLKGFFPVLTNRMISYLSSTTYHDLVKFTGDKYVIDDVGIKAAERIKMISPDKRIFYPLLDKGKLIFNKFDMEGIFRIFSENVIIKKIAVNVPPLENDNNFLNLDVFVRRYGLNKDKFIWIDLNEKTKKNYMIMERRDLSTIFIIFSICLLVLETYLSRINKISNVRDEK